MPRAPISADKAAAYSAVKIALRRGTLVRPKTCEKCFAEPPPTRNGGPAIQAHHEDYSRPLHVQWICAKCHRKETPLPKVMGAPAFGESNGQAKLTEVDVRSIRRLRSVGHSYRAIAERFGVDHKTILWAATGKQWAHVKDAASPQPHKQGDAK